MGYGKNKGLLLRLSKLGPGPGLRTEKEKQVAKIKTKLAYGK